MLRKVRIPILLLLGLAALGLAQAQESASFKLNEHSFNAGGHPDQGTVMASASFAVSLDAIGDAVSLTGLTSASFQLDTGSVAPYPPPGEVTGLIFVDDETLQWDPEPSVGSYSLYRELISSVAGLGYGSCEQQEIPDETTTDNDLPPGSDGFFYLVTAANLLGEEGTKGYDSSATERPTPAPCP